MKKPVRVTLDVTMRTTDIEGKPLVKRWQISGDVLDVSELTDPVVNMARRNGIYMEPAEHMTKRPDLLDRHDRLEQYALAHKEADALVPHRNQLKGMWWEWHDNVSLDLVRWQEKLSALERTMRVAYADWLCAMLAAYKAVDARYSLKTAVRSYLNGRLKVGTFDAKVVVARERLRRLEK